VEHVPVFVPLEPCTGEADVKSISIEVVVVLVAQLVLVLGFQDLPPVGHTCQEVGAGPVGQLPDGSGHLAVGVGRDVVVVPGQVAHDVGNSRAFDADVTGVFILRTADVLNDQNDLDL
jgi:hypothetical protein